MQEKSNPARLKAAADKYLSLGREGGELQTQPGNARHTKKG